MTLFSDFMEKGAKTRIKIHAAVTLPFCEVELSRQDDMGISVLHGETYYWIPYSSIQWVELVSIEDGEAA